MAKILIIDDDPSIGDTLKRVVSRLGHSSDVEQSLQKGLSKAENSDYDVVFLDVRMPDGNGLEVIPSLKRMPSSPEVVVITGWGDPDGAETAIRRGAWDYIEKPPSVAGMTQTLERALAYRASLNKKASVSFSFEGIAGANITRIKCLELASQACLSQANVLISGETGTGKELVARAIHAGSARAANEFVVVDCAALPETIVESVLFGNERGAYTGADRSREGLIVQADQGTLFLDEVGELPLVTQKAFLRVLQERRVRPVGGNKERSCDFRLVSATNRDLEAMAAQGLFRPDLLFRLRGAVIELPSLRSHQPDILIFTKYYLSKIWGRLGIKAKAISKEFEQALQSYPWPGNIRELVNTLEGVCVQAMHDPVLLPVHLPMAVRIQAARSRVSEKEPPMSLPESDQSIASWAPETSGLPSMRAQRLADEKKYLIKLIAQNGSDPSKACAVSGLSRSRLYALLKKHNLNFPR